MAQQCSRTQLDELASMCPLCADILHEPVRASCSKGHLVCESCWIKAQPQSCKQTRCPCCKSVATSTREKNVLLTLLCGSVVPDERVHRPKCTECMRQYVATVEAERDQYARSYKNLFNKHQRLHANYEALVSMQQALACEYVLAPQFPS